VGNIIRPVIKFLSIAQYVALGIGGLVGLLVVITSCNSGSSTQVSNLVVFIPVLGIFFLSVFGFFWLAKYMLEGCEEKLEFKPMGVQVAAVIAILLVALVGAALAGAVLLIMLMHSAYRRLPK